jgi:hypothetical protein
MSLINIITLIDNKLTKLNKFKPIVTLKLKLIIIKKRTLNFNIK